jgi:hypothetical protein
VDYIPWWRVENMSILKKLNFKTIVIILSMIIVISFGIIYLLNINKSIITKPGWEEVGFNDWVIIGSNDEYSYYYNKKSIVLDYQDYIIKVWLNFVYTDKGKQLYLKTYKEDKYKEFNSKIYVVLFNYKKMEYNERKVYILSKSDNIIDSFGSSDIWKDIFPGSIIEDILNKLIKDYNIKR